jgi:hypothetical protein
VIEDDRVVDAGRRLVVSVLGSETGDALAEHRRRDHEDDQEHEHDVHQGRDVDVREMVVGIAAGFLESHLENPVEG